MPWLSSTHLGLNGPAVQTQSQIGDQPGSHFGMLNVRVSKRATGDLLTRVDGKSGGECQGVRPRI